MIKKILPICLCIVSIQLNAQTKTISYKRNGGNMTEFSSFLISEGSKGGPSNLGVAPERWIRNSELKKVIFINDTTQAMVTEESCQNTFSSAKPEIWRAGTDTVLHHPVFSSNLSEDSMRTILKAEYYFANDMKEVKFVNFENRTVDKDKKVNSSSLKAQLQKLKEKKSTGKSNGRYTWIALILASSIGIGIIKLR